MLKLGIATKGETNYEASIFFIAAHIVFFSSITTRVAPLSVVSVIVGRGQTTVARQNGKGYCQ
jgi:hypothetical protein